MKLLFLTHRIPYPPNKGEKISMFHMMTYFGARHDLYLGTFVDDTEDRPHVRALAPHCADACAIQVNRRLRTLLSARGLLTGESLTTLYYRSRRMQRWVDRILRDIRPDAVLLYSGATGQFVAGRTAPPTRVVFNLEDVDSEKWRQYAANAARPLRWLYGREGRRLQAYERKMAQAFDATVLISVAEAELFRRLAPESAEKIVSRGQGVDVGFFDPDRDYPSPYAPDEKALVFVGAMNYRPNITAASWFAEECFPEIRAAIPEARFYIVGLSPTERVRRLGDRPGVTVTGAVPDVRPYLKHAHAVCLPIAIGRGVQNKMLEAMAMRKRIISTPEAAAGVRTGQNYAPDYATTRDEFVAAAGRILGEARREESAARGAVLQHHSWDATLSRLERLVFEGRLD